MLRLSRLPLASLLAVTAIAAGCGDDESTTTSETVSVSTTTETVSSTEESTTTAEDGGAPPADTTVTKLTGFTSPTENIGCFIDRRSVRCDIAERTWEPPPAPPDCDLDYGQGISMDAGGPPDFVCAGDTALGGGKVLPYGESIAAGLLRCESAEDGITCSDAESGRGFRIAREDYELF